MSRHPDLGPVIEGGANPAERRRTLAHVADCPRCRGELARREPSLLFSLLALVEPPSGALERLSSSVAEALDGRAAPAARPQRRVAGSLAAALVLAGLLGTYVWRWETPGLSPAAGPAVRTVEAAESPWVTAPAMQFELLSSPGSAEVIDLSVGDTQLVMIFDEALDI